MLHTYVGLRWLYWATVICCGSLVITTLLLLGMLLNSMRVYRPVLARRTRVALFIASMVCAFGFAVFDLLRSS